MINTPAIAAALTLFMSPAPAADRTERQGKPTPAPRQSTEEPTPRTPADVIAPNFLLSGDEVSFPFVVVKGIPFIEATINGVRGKLMLDTGAERALSLNNRRIPLTGGRAAGRGLFGSGQRFDLMLHANVSTVMVGDLSFRDITNVESQAAQLLEGITPDFAGWMGFNFWRGYALKLDYVNNIATFYRDESPTKGRPSKYLAGETVLGVIRYETRKLSNVPIANVRIGSQSLEGMFDTGNSGFMWVDDAMRARLMSDGKLMPAQQESAPMMLEGFAIESAGSYRMTVRVLASPFPAAAPLGVKTSNVVVFGHSFLSQYKTVWDFAQKTIYLLKK